MRSGESSIEQRPDTRMVSYSGVMSVGSVVLICPHPFVAVKPGVKLTTSEEASHGHC